MRLGRPSGGQRRLVLLALLPLLAVSAVAAVVLLRDGDDSRSVPQLLRSGRFVGERVTIEGRVTRRFPGGAFRVRLDGLEEPLLVLPGRGVALPDRAAGHGLRIAGTLDRVDEITGIPGAPRDTLQDNAPLIRANEIERVTSG